MADNRFDYNGSSGDNQNEEFDSTQENNLDTPEMEEYDEADSQDSADNDEQNQPEDPEELEQMLRQDYLSAQYDKLDKKINHKLDTNSMLPPFLKREEKQLMNDALHNRQLKAKATRTETKRKSAIGQWVMKMTQSAAPFVPWLLLGGLILLIALVVAQMIDMMFAWLSGGSGGGTGGGGMNSQFGANGNNFHAVRLVYEDDEEAAKYILNDYANLVYDALDEVKNGEDYTVTINVTLPEDKTADFDETTADEKIKTILNTLTEKAYVYDNSNYAEQGIDLATLTLTEKAKGIKYFGLNAELLGQFKEEIVSNFILFNFNAEGGIVSFTPVGEAEVDEATVKENIQTALDNFFASQGTTRSQKYFVYDQVLQGDKMLENVAQKKYVAMMYLPKTNTTINNLTLNVYGVDTENFSIEYGGKTFNDYTEWPVNDDITMYQYQIISSTTTLQSVSYNSATAVTKPTALYKLSGTEAEASYITTDENGVVTYIENGVVIKFNSALPFAFADEITLN